MRISKKQYNEIVAKLELLEKTINKGGGNPYHDELGRFAESPVKAFGEYKADNNMVYGPNADYKGGGGDHDKENDRYRPFTGAISLADNDIRTTMTKEQADATMQTMGALRKMEKDAKKLKGDEELVYAVREAIHTLMGYTYTVGYRSSHGSNPEPGEWSNASWRTYRLDETTYELKALQAIAKAAKTIQPLAKAATSAFNTMKYIDKNTKTTGPLHVYSVSKKSGLTEREIDNSLSNKADNLITKIDRITNGGKGSGNFGHSGRPGEVGGSGTGKGGHSKDAEKSESRSWYDDGNFGTAPMVIDEKDGKYKVKSFGDEQATRGLLGSDATLSEVAGLAYDKSLKGEKATEKQQQVFQQITAIRQLLQQKVGEMGDAMSFKDKKFDFDDFDTTMSHVDEYLSKARLGTVGDKSKVGETLSKSLTRLSNVSGVLKMIADPDMLKKHDEAQWYDIDEQIKRRKNSLGNKANNLIAKMEKIINGGKGSGNFGHSGRPGKVGGSGKGDIVSASRAQGLEHIDGEHPGLVSSPDSNLGVTPHDFEEARDKAIKRGGDIEVKETDYKTYRAGNKFYDREFQSKREAESFRDGYTYAKDATAFTQVDYIRTKDEQGSLRWDVMWKGTDVGVGEKTSFKNPLEAQRWTEGYNAFIIAMESEVPSDKWIKKK